ncbi:NTP transferase domain-containing protein [uncultured Hymenobacter sp.]|uniref:nucleotidyltransferase family protein n=1 Tax=uncultured Hymenobacter sp. TaxID=170016 RepID=UPI0035C9C2F8
MLFSPTPATVPPALLLLAAGASVRLGQPKQLLAYRGQTLLRRAAETAAAAGCRPLVLVTGALHEELLPEVAGLPFLVARNAQWAEGLGASVRAGMAALAAYPPSATAAAEGPPPAVLLLLCDQPLLTAAHLQALLRVQHETGRVAVASAYAGTAGVPVVFGSALFERLRTLSGAAGAQQLLASLPPSELATIDFPAGAVDVDTPAQYAQLLADGPQY